MVLLKELLDFELNECEIVYFDDEGNELLDESAVKQFKLSKGKMTTKYRCLAGPKKGRLVATPSACSTRKDIKKVIHGRKVMRSKGASIKRKGVITQQKSANKLVKKMNKRMSGGR